MLNRYRGQKNHGETVRAVTFGSLVLTAWAATLATLALLPGEGAVSIIDMPVAEAVAEALPDVEVATIAAITETR